MSEAKTLVTLMLGGVFNGTSGPELGDIDYQVNFEETLALQQELVTNDDVYVDLVARTDFDAQRLRADTAEAELAKFEGEIVAALPGVRFMDLPDGGSPTLAEQVSRMAEALAAAEQRIAEMDALLNTALLAMKRIYEAGRDFIIGTGSDCDSVELMMENDPSAREIRAALSPKPDGHYSDCATNNRGVPELLGPCDCGYDGGKSK